MAGRGYYVKTVHRPTRPGSIVGVAVETDGADLGGGLDCDVLRTFRAAHVSAARLSHGRWSYPHSETFTKPEAFWAWLQGWGQDWRTTHVFGTVVSDILTLLRLWHILDVSECRWEGAHRVDPGADGGPLGPDCWSVRSMVLRGRPDVVNYSRQARRFRWASVGQFLRTDHAALARDFGYTFTSEAARTVAVSAGVAPPQDEAALIRHSFCHLSDWWGSLNAGPWRDTASGLAMSFWRSRLKPRSVCTNSDTEANRLEALARHGARMSTWFYGEVRDGGADGTPIPGVSVRGRKRVIPGPCHLVDVRSMYPHIMKTERFPVKWRRTYDAPSVADVDGVLGPMGVIAHCVLRTATPEYPHRSGDRVVYPTGVFTGTLCGPELRRAIDDGEVVRITSAALYDLGEPFATAAGELIDLRSKARERGDDTGETLTKLLANSLTGRLAMRQSRWVRSPGATAERRWGEWTGRTHGSAEVHRFRGIAGLVWRLDKQDTGTGTLTAQYAHITSHGRYMMRQIRERLPVCSVISQHTDGLWLTSSGYASAVAQGIVRTSSASGTLALDTTRREGRWWSPAHYRTESGWVLGGYHRPSGTTARQLRDSYTLNPIRTCPTGPIASYTQKVRITSLEEERDLGWIDPFGWLHPIELPSRGFRADDGG